MNACDEIKTLALVSDFSSFSDQDVSPASSPRCCYHRRAPQKLAGFNPGSAKTKPSSDNAPQPSSAKQHVKRKLLQPTSTTKAGQLHHSLRSPASRPIMHHWQKFERFLSLPLQLFGRLLGPSISSSSSSN